MSSLKSLLGKASLTSIKPLRDHETLTSTRAATREGERVVLCCCQGKRSENTTSMFHYFFNGFFLHLSLDYTDDPLICAFLVVA